MNFLILLNILYILKFVNTVSLCQCSFYSWFYEDHINKFVLFTCYCPGIGNLKYSDTMGPVAMFCLRGNGITPECVKKINIWPAGLCTYAITVITYCL